MSSSESIIFYTCTQSELSHIRTIDNTGINWLFDLYLCVFLSSFLETWELISFILGSISPLVMIVWIVLYIFKDKFGESKKP